MSDVTLQQIVAIACKESADLNQYYIGVEHLFMALTRIKGGITAELLEQKAMLGYLQQAVRDGDLGPGYENRSWPNYRSTPRAEAVLRAAQDSIARGTLPEDRALLLAILNEADSVPIRILQQWGADTDVLRDTALNWTEVMRPVAPDTPIETSVPNLSLNDEEQSILRQMFPDAMRINVKREMVDGFGGSRVLLVQTVRLGLKNAPVVVKMDDRQAIQVEKLRYDQLVKDILPPNAARLIGEPTLPPGLTLGGVKYTFISQPDADTPMNMREHVAEYGPHEAAQFIREALYEAYRPFWWGQNQIYHFQVWQEYELLLPPALVLEWLPDDSATHNTRIIHPTGNWSYKGGVQIGEKVILENFVVQKVRRKKSTLQLSAGAHLEASARASRVEVQGIDFSAASFILGQTPRLVGRVISTRDDLLQHQVQSLEPNFDLLAEAISDPSGGLVLPNPLRYYARLLDRWMDGLLSPIHGDLHMGNVLMGPAGDAWLIDFEWTRRGHALFDWAVFEINLVTDMLVPLIDESWETCWALVRVFDMLNRRAELPADLDPNLAAAFGPIYEVRRIASELLSPGALWSEYYAALTLCAIRVPSWPNRPLSARRLTFLLSALYMEMARAQQPIDADSGTINKTATDLRKVNSP